MSNIIDRAETARLCLRKAEAVKIALELCSSTDELREVFAELGLKSCRFTRSFSRLSPDAVAAMDEWRDGRDPFEARLLPMYGAIMVVNHEQPWTQARVLVSDATRRRLLDL